jgi:hypothetical protein
MSCGLWRPLALLLPCAEQRAESPEAFDGTWRGGWRYALEVNTRGLGRTARRTARRWCSALSASLGVSFGSRKHKSMNQHFAEFGTQSAGNVRGLLFVRLSVSNLTNALRRAVP